MRTLAIVLALALIACTDPENMPSNLYPDGIPQGAGRPPRTGRPRVPILNIGDSLQAGYFLADLGGYRIRLATLRPDLYGVGRIDAGPSSIDGTAVYAGMDLCEGYAGEGFVYLAARAAEVDPRTWDAALVMAGTAQSILESRGSLPASSVATLVNALGSGSIFLALPPPIDAASPDFPAAETLLAGYRVEMTALAAARSNVTLVDTFAGYTGGTSDGVHPTLTGYNWIADQFYAELLP